MSIKPWSGAFLLAAGLLIPQCSSSSAPKRRTGNDLLKMCPYVDRPITDQPAGEKALTLSCLNCTSGFLDRVLAGSIAASKNGQPLICPSEEVTPPQVAPVVLKYLRAHPEDRHEDALSLVYVALARAFALQASTLNERTTRPYRPVPHPVQ